MSRKTILHYQILEKLGQGGMGVVYKAEDTKLKREVAIKFLPRHIVVSEEEQARFKVEAQAAAALNHINIATIYAIEEVNDEIFIAMEYIDGQELKEKISQGQVDIEESIKIAIQIAEGLNAAHKKDIIHRDIKSANIMLTNEGQVKIMDFGLAKIRGGAQLTKEQSTLGTAAYMSPEQTRGEEIDQRTDIWSLGVVMYEMLTCDLPFKGDYEQAVIY
jgi:serine/threonine protein kinase